MSTTGSVRSAGRRAWLSTVLVRTAAVVLVATAVPVASLIWASGVAKGEVERRALDGLASTAKATVLQEQQAWDDAVRVITSAGSRPVSLSAILSRDPLLARQGVQNILVTGPFAAVRIYDGTGSLVALATLPDVTPTPIRAFGPPGLVIGEPVADGARIARQVVVPIGPSQAGRLVVDVDVTRLLGQPADLAFGRTGVKFLVTPAGLVVAGSGAVGTPLRSAANRAIVAHGRPVTNVAYSPFYGRVNAQSYEPIPDQSMGILVQQARSEIMGGADSLAALLHLAALLVALLGCALAVSLGVLLSRRSRRLAASEQRVSENEAESRHRLKQFLDAIPIGVVVAAPDGRSEYANPEAERLLGRGIMPGAGMPGAGTGSGTGEGAEVYRAFVAGTDEPYPAAESPLTRALLGETTHVDDMEVRGLDALVPVEVWGSAVLAADHSVEFAVTAVADVSERRRASDQVQFLSAITASMSEGVVLVRSQDSTIAYANGSYETMFGYQPGELVGRNIRDLTVPDPTSSETFSAIGDAVRASGRWRGEIHALRKDGTSLWCAVNITPLQHPTLGAAWIAVNTDITARRDAEQGQARLASIVRASREAILGKSLDGVVTSWNHGAEVLFGYTAAEMVDSRIEVLIPPDGREDEAQMRARVARGLGVEQYETVRVRKDGSSVAVAVTLSPVEDPDGSIVGIAAICRDVTDRNRAEAKFQGLLESAPDAIVVMGSDGLIRLVNRQTEVVFGWSRSEMVGQPVELLIPDRLSGHHPAQRAGFFANPSVRAMGANLELAARRKDGSEFPVDISLSPLDTEEGVLVSASVRDVTERKRAEAALREREEQLAAARDQALEASRLKSQFLATMSHEIRTPMNGVLGMAQLLLTGQLEPEQRARVLRLHESGQTLLTIINDILDVSKMEAGKLEVEVATFDLAAAVESVVNLCSSPASEKCLRLTLNMAAELPEQVRGDSLRLRQVLLNLLGNAVKFTETGGVDLTVSPVTPSRLRFSIHDTGIGLDQSAKAHLMEPFSQADASTTRRFGGTGLGLAICGQLVELMGGTLDFTSQPGVGSTFWFELDLPEAEPDMATRSSSSAASGEPTRRLARGSANGVRILLVDDVEINRDVGQGLLQSVGYQVDAVSSGAEAVEAVQRATYAAVLMDCLMPGMDGYETTRRIRALGGPVGRVPIIALTAAAMSGDRDRCLAAGMDDFVSKPLELDTLTTLLARLGSDRAEVYHDEVYQDDVYQDEETGLVERLQALRSILPDSFDRICETFLAATPDLIADLAAAVRADNADTVRQAAHTLKGSVANLGAGRLSALAQRVEAGEGGGDAILLQIDREYDRTRAVVRSLMTLDAGA